MSSLVARVADMEDADRSLYVVLCRHKWERVWRADIPPVLGGVGPLSAPLDPRICVAKLEQLCARQPVVSTSFLEPRLFPGHPHVYLPPTAEHELDAFAARLAAAGARRQLNLPPVLPQLRMLPACGLGRLPF
jgi:hypothetical protein